MLSEEEKESIEFFEESIKKDHIFEEDLTLYFMQILLNLIPRLQREKEIYVGLMHQYQKEWLDLKEELREKDKEIKDLQSRKKV